MDGKIRIIPGSPVFLQYYVPFRFNDDRFREISGRFASEAQDGTALWQKAAFPIDNTTVFYDHVLSMMNVRENGNSVCQSWKRLRPEGSRYMFLCDKDEEIRFSLSEIYVHLFKAGTGFLSYQVVLEDGAVQDSGQLITLQCRLKKLNRKDKALWIFDETSAGEKPDGQAGPSSWKQVRLGRKIAELLPEGISPEVEFFSAADKFPIPAAALMFSYLCYDCEDRDRLREAAVHMAMGFDLTNKQSEETIRSCHELASNVYFYVSQNGCAISVNPNELNRDFFVNHSPAAKYNFILFILLYQHCSLLNFTMRLCAGFPSDSRAYLGNADYADKMQDFMTDVDTFLLKNDIATVSHVHFHNYFYAVSRKALNIEEDKQALRSGFDSLSGIQKSHQYQDIQEKQEKQNHRINIIAIFLAVLALLPEFCDLDFTARIITFFTKGWSALKPNEQLSVGVFFTIFATVVILIVFLLKKQRPGDKRRK